MEIIGSIINVPFRQGSWPQKGVELQDSWTEISDELPQSSSDNSGICTQWLKLDNNVSLEPESREEVTGLVSERQNLQRSVSMAPEDGQRDAPNFYGSVLPPSGSGLVFRDHTESGEVSLMPNSLSKRYTGGRRYKLQRSWNTKFLGVQRRFRTFRSRQRQSCLKLDPMGPASPTCYHP